MTVSSSSRASIGCHGLLALGISLQQWFRVSQLLAVARANNHLDSRLIRSRAAASTPELNFHPSSGLREQEEEDLNRPEC
uniref:Secreted protein n=1 Tax=Macrostomum lignano TaxID=282301 RepID=A0A1I8JP24_9PLAT